MCEYESFTAYINSAEYIKDKLNRVEAVINALYDAATEAADPERAVFDEYWLDDGQSKIKAMHRSPEDIFKAIHNYEKIKQMYMNRIQGRVSIARRC